MAKASERKGVRTEEYACCAAERQRWAEQIEKNYLTFPVIKKVPCPTCSMILEIRYYDRPSAEAESA